MSTTAHKWLVERTPDVPDSGRASKLVCLLAWHHNGRTGQLNPSHATLADEMGCSERTVRRAVVELRTVDLIRTYQRSRGRDGRESIAYVLVPNGGTVPRAWRPPGAKRVGPLQPDNKVSGKKASSNRTDMDPPVPVPTGHTGGHQTGKNSGGVSKAAANQEEGGASVGGAPTPPSTNEAGEGEGEAPSTHASPTPPSFDSGCGAVVTKGISEVEGCNGVVCAKAEAGHGACDAGCERAALARARREARAAHEELAARRQLLALNGDAS